MPPYISTIQQQQIIDGRAAGHTLDKVASMTGTCRDTVRRYSKKLRDVIEARAFEFLEKAVPKSTDLHLQCLDKARQAYETADTLPDTPEMRLLEHNGRLQAVRIPAERSAYLADNSALLAQAHKVSDRVLQSVGIAPSQAPSVVVQQFIQVNQTAILAPQLTSLFSPESLAAMPADAVDAEWEELGDVEPDE